MDDSVNDQAQPAPTPAAEKPTFRRRGRPRTQAKPARSRTARPAAELPTVESPSIVPEERGREATGTGSVFRGRGGEILTRRRKDGTDIFEVTPPQGWSYQWCAVSVVGNKEVVADQNLGFAENGWRPVMAQRHDGQFMPAGYKGAIIRGSQMLMERPLAMTLEAQREEERKARQQMQDRDQSLLGGKANVRGGMPTGFEMRGNQLKMSIDPGLDIPAPKHSVAK